jgi:hypothetical protein
MAAGRGVLYSVANVLTLPSLLRLPRPVPHWRSLCHLSGAPEAALVSARCQFSLSTVEVMCNSSALFCALVEQEHPDTWRWAVYGTEDNALAEGTAPTHAGARRSAIRSLINLDHAGVLKLHNRHPVAPPVYADTPDQAA